MTSTAAARRWRGPPLALQIMGLLLAGLVVAQGATLALTLLLPPEPRPQWDMGDIAQVLTGRQPDNRNARLLLRTLQAGPPEAKGPGWLLSDAARRDLARLLERPEDEVRLYFYTPLPFAGTGIAAAAPRPVTHAALDGPAGFDDGLLASLPAPAFLRVQAGGGRGGGMGDMGGLGGSRLGGPVFQDQGIPPRSPPDTTVPAASPARSATETDHLAGNPATAPATSAGTAAAEASRAPAAPTGTVGSPAAAATASPAAPSAAGRDGAGGAQQPAAAPSTPTRAGGADAPPPRAVPPAAENRAAVPATPQPRASDAAELSTHATPAQPRKAATAAVRAAPPAPAASATPRSQTAPPAASGSPPKATSATSTAPVAPAQPVEVRPAARGLFGLAPAPFVEGDFIAAVHTQEGSWVVVQPIPEPFPNAWQRRVLLWFAIAAAVVLPAGWLFSRRLVRPLSGFARAAERLGRDPSAPVLALEGPAEIGRAAQAFNRMQSRLRSFVDDRTVMIGAISHDLRTPLTRMRFRIEDVPEDVRSGMLDDVEEMEQMIGAVLAFIRDASTPGTREQMNLASLVDDVVEQAVFVGKNVRLVHAVSAPVEVDAIGMRRVLDNLIENAVKYGTQARVRLFRDGDDAIVEIGDSGPGLSDDELERVFQPFYRTPGARASGVAGSGLGLAVCRSIARAHGGDVVLKPGAHGLVAQLRVPLAVNAVDPAWAA